MRQVPWEASRELKQGTSVYIAKGLGSFKVNGKNTTGLEAELAVRR